MGKEREVDFGKERGGLWAVARKRAPTLYTGERGEVTYSLYSWTIRVTVDGASDCNLTK